MHKLSEYRDEDDAYDIELVFDIPVEEYTLDDNHI